MKSNFERLLPEILKHEGGFVDHPRDPGGATNKGITIGTYRAYVNPNGTVDDLRALTEDQAAKVYRAEYWDKVRGDELPSGIDYVAFDFAVNSGPGRAARYLQNVVGAAQDGVVGPATIAATRRMDPDTVINQVCDDRLAFMQRIRGGVLWKTFGRGWSRRVSEVRALALDLMDVVAPRIEDMEPEPPAPRVLQATDRSAPVNGTSRINRGVDVPTSVPEPAKSVPARVTPLQSTTIWAQLKQFAVSVLPIGYSGWSALQEQDPTTRYIVLGGLILATLYILHLGRHIISERLKKWAAGDR